MYAQSSASSQPGQPAASVVAIRLSDGRVLWHTPLPASGISLAVNGTTVLAADETSGLYALDTTSGAIRWHVPLHTSGQLLASAGVVVLTRTDAVLPNTYVETTCLAAFRVRDGAPLWCIPNFTGADGISQFAIYVKDGQNNYAALSIPTGRFLWEVIAPGTLAAISDQMLLLSDLQTVTAADARTGRVLWQASLNFEGAPSGYPTSAAWATPDTAVAVGSYQYEVLALSSGDGSALWHVMFSGFTPGQLVVESGIVVVTLLPPPESSTPERLAACDARTGKVYWERDVSDSFMFLADFSAAYEHEAGTSALALHASEMPRRLS